MYISKNPRRAARQENQSARISGEIDRKLDDASGRIGSAISALDKVKVHLQGESRDVVYGVLDELRDLQSKTDAGFVGRTIKRLRSQLVPSINGALDAQTAAERFGELNVQLAGIGAIAARRLNQLDSLTAAEQAARRLSANINDIAASGAVRARIGSEKAPSNEAVMIERLKGIDLPALEKELSELVYAKHAINGVKGASTELQLHGVERARAYINDYPITFIETVVPSSRAPGASEAAGPVTAQTPAITGPTLMEVMGQELISIEAAELMKSLEIHYNNVADMIDDYIKDARSYKGSKLGAFINGINTEQLVLFSKAHIYATGHPGNAALVNEINTLLNLSNDAIINLSAKMRSAGYMLEPRTVPFDGMAQHGQPVLSAMAEASAVSHMADSMADEMRRILGEVLTGPGVPANAAQAVLRELHKDRLLISAARREAESQPQATVEPLAVILQLSPQSEDGDTSA